MRQSVLWRTSILCHQLCCPHTTKKFTENEVLMLIVFSLKWASIYQCNPVAHFSVACCAIDFIVSTKWVFLKLQHDMVALFVPAHNEVNESSQLRRLCCGACLPLFIQCDISFHRSSMWDYLWSGRQQGCVQRAGVFPLAWDELEQITSVFKSQVRTSPARWWFECVMLEGLVNHVYFSGDTVVWAGTFYLYFTFAHHSSTSGERMVCRFVDRGRDVWTEPIYHPDSTNNHHTPFILYFGTCNIESWVAVFVVSKQ